MNILAVDDNPINVELIMDIAESAGWQVESAYDGPSALTHIRQNPPDLVLLDVNMPGMTGYEVCARIKGDPATAYIQVIMLTAMGDIDHRVEGLAAGADDYLTKPFSARELIARIETRLRAKSESDALRASREVIRDTFERFVPASVVERLLDDPSSVRLGGHMREITVMFADLENFTTISEATPPDELLNVLNAYHALMVDEVMAQAGTVDKFMGDAVMALFNTPLDQPDHIERAVRAALGIQAVLPGFHAHLPERFRMKVNIGIHSGPAVVGNVGAPQIMDFTAVGDTVNIASRLQGASSGGQVYVSQAVLDALAGRCHAQPIGDIPLKGRSKTVTTYSLTKLGYGESSDTASSPA